MLLSLHNKLPPIFKANCPHNKSNSDSGVLSYIDTDPLPPDFAVQLSNFKNPLDSNSKLLLYKSDEVLKVITQSLKHFIVKLISSPRTSLSLIPTFTKMIPLSFGLVSSLTPPFSLSLPPLPFLSSPHILISANEPT